MPEPRYSSPARTWSAIPLSSVFASGVLTPKSTAARSASRIPLDTRAISVRCPPAAQAL